MDAAGAGLVPFALGRNCRCECASEAVTVSEVSVSKVCVQADRDGDPVAVDLVLPSGTQLAELLPTIVGLVDAPTPTGGVARRWRLQRASGARLDESLSLSANGVRDGELVILDFDGTPALGPVRRAAYQHVAGTCPVDPRGDAWIPGAIALFATTLAALVLAGTAGSDGATVNAVVCAAAAAAVAVLTVVTGYSTTSSAGVVALAGATGFLVVPSGPAAPNVFLAAAAALSASLLMLRLSGRTSPTLVAIAALSLLSAVVTVAALPLTVVGAALSTLALALLGLAPRVSTVTAGLGPDRWHGDLAASAAAGHAILSGLVAGAAAGAAAGAVVVAVAGHPGAAPFTGLVALVLVLRCRIHADADRRISLTAGGLVALIAGVCALLHIRPGSVVPVAAALLVLGLMAMRRPTGGAAAGRMLGYLEYAALVAVVPVACWVGGAYTALGLP